MSAVRIPTQIIVLCEHLREKASVLPCIVFLIPVFWGAILHLIKCLEDNWCMFCEGGGRPGMLGASTASARRTPWSGSRPSTTVSSSPAPRKPSRLTSVTSDWLLSLIYHIISLVGFCFRLVQHAEHRPNCRPDPANVHGLLHCKGKIK